MAEAACSPPSGLVPLLAERGIGLSASQVHRLVTGTPERLSLPVLAALCDILDVTPDSLIVTSAGNITAPRKAGPGAPAVTDLAADPARSAPGCARDSQPVLPHPRAV